MAGARARTRAGVGIARLRRPLLAVLAVVAAVGVPVTGHAAGSGTPARGAVPPATSVRVWPLGDSITVGASWPADTPGGYRTALDEVLAHDGFSHRFVGTSTENSSPTLDADGQTRHDGHGGYRVDQVLRDLDGVAHSASDDGGRWLTTADVGRRVTPDVVLIHLGTNDLLQHWDTRRFPGRTGRASYADPRQRARFVADLTARLATLLSRIHRLRPACQLIVATIVPIDSSRYAAVVSAYAVAVRRLVTVFRAKGLPVSLADLYAAFTVTGAPGSPVIPGMLSADRIHPSAAGYAVMARTFAAAIEAH